LFANTVCVQTTYSIAADGCSLASDHLVNVFCCCSGWCSFC